MRRQQPNTLALCDVFREPKNVSLVSFRSLPPSATVPPTAPPTVLSADLKVPQLVLDGSHLLLVGSDAVTRCGGNHRGAGAR